MDSLLQDVRYAARSLIKRPGFALVAVATLAMGIGGNAAVFSVVNSVLLQPLPIENAERLTWVWGRMFPSGPGASVSPADYMDLKAGTDDVFEHLAAFTSFANTVVIDVEGRPEEFSSRAVTPDLLQALGYVPAMGRTFVEDDVQRDEPDVVMLTHGLWGRMFGFDRQVVGTTLRVDGQPLTVVGILPEGLDFPTGVDLWLPFTVGGGALDTRAAHYLRPLGLLREGTTLAGAQASLDRVSARLEDAYPDTNEGWYAQVRSLQEVTVGSARPALMVLLGGVGLVLLIACGNVANLLLARAAARRGEVAVRAAMGASRLRLARQVIIESLLLAGVAGAAGVALAYLGVEAVRVLEPGNLPRVDEIAVDGTALAFSAALSLMVGLVFGAAPAFALGRGDLRDALGAAGRGRATGSGRLRNALVAGEVAVSFMLLVGAGLLIRSFMELRNVDPGFDAVGAVTLPVSFPERDYPDDEAVEVLRDAITERLASLPGVEAVGAASVLPLSGGGGDTYVYAEGRPPTQVLDVANTAQVRTVDEGYFQALGVPIVAGRGFDATDDRTAPTRVILNERLARDLFPDEDPIGRNLILALADDRPFEIVGVAADVRQYSLASPASREFYLPARNRAARSLDVVVRGVGGVEPPVAALRDAVWEVDPRQPIGQVTPLTSFLDGNLAQGRFQAMILGAFAILAVVLSAVGIYGVLAQVVGERRREIGIRMALGAERAGVTRMVVRQGMGMALVGAALGLVGAFATARVLSSMLYGVGTADPVTYALTPAFLLVAVLVSSWLPARHAARTDPATVLREEG